MVGDDKEPQVCGVDCGAYKKCKQHNVNKCNEKELDENGNQLVGDDKEPKVCGVDCGAYKKCKQHNVNECSVCGERCGRYKKCRYGCKTTKRKR